MNDKTFNSKAHSLADELLSDFLEYPKEATLDTIKYTLKELSLDVKRYFTQPYTPSSFYIYWRRIFFSAAYGYMEFKNKSHVDGLFTEVADLVIKKQHDYGPSNIMNSPFGPEVGIVVRMFDKVARMENLTQNSRVPKNESIEDTWLDIMGYSFIGLMLCKKYFTLPLEA